VETPLGLAETSAGATELAVISRGTGRRDLVAISCQTQGSVDIYDDEIGRVVASIQGVGSQPYALAVQPNRPGGGVRLFVSAFGQGDIGVIDIPDLDNPQSAYVVAQIGPNENCLNDEVSLRPPECTAQEEIP
jgi:hypothetical protein